MLRNRQKIGKYRIEKCLAKGPFANVYQGFDTIEGLRYALKVPHPYLADEQFMADFRKEARLTVRLDHEHILSAKDASLIDGHFVIVTPLGQKTLAERIARRMTVETALKLTEQMLSAVAYAHEKRIIHCDIKPDNFILFPGNRLRLADFGIAKVAMHTVRASGSGTLGYLAPEQAMGRPCYQSDVFSLGLIVYRMLTGKLPEWPYDWPPPGHERLERPAVAPYEPMLQKALAVQPADRYADARAMQADFRAIRARKVRPVNGAAKNTRHNGKRGWRELRGAQFRREFGRALDLDAKCRRCDGPVADAMAACPWCGVGQPCPPGETRFPAYCPDCHGGAKLDWHYCGWCGGPGFESAGSREYSDARYSARCANRSCDRKLIMPFMHHCPWCRTPVTRRWKIAGSRDRCHDCGWGVVRDYWRYCPWCSSRLEEDG